MKLVCITITLLKFINAWFIQINDILKKSTKLYLKAVKESKALKNVSLNSNVFQFNE